MYILLTIVLLLLSLIIHEYAHVIAVRFFGGKVERVGFFPLGMMARARGLERLCGRERYVIFAAGPAANFALAFWAATTSHMSYVGVAWLDRLAFYNLVLGVFNLMPALPLDGGRILWQFLGNSVGILRGARIMARLGAAVAAAFIIFGVAQAVLVPFNVTLLLAGIFVWRKNKAAQTEFQAAFHLALDGKNSRERARLLPHKTVKIAADTPLKIAYERLANDYFIEFLVGEEKIPLHENQLLAHIFDHGLSDTLESCTANHSAINYPQ